MHFHINANKKVNTMERNANAYYDLVKGAVEAFNERIQYDELTEDSDYHSALHEVVDGMVPHYYHEIFTVMAADGIDFIFDDSDMMPDTKDISVMCQARIYEALYAAVIDDVNIEWWEEPEEEADEHGNTMFFVINEETFNRGSHIWQGEDFDKACEVALGHYTTMGLRCHVEGDTSEDNLYDPDSLTGTSPHAE